MKSLILSAIALTLSYAPVQAQQNCGHYEDIVTQLAQKYGESLQSLGDSDGVLIQMFVNHGTGTWTILQTSSNGVSCIVAVGDKYIGKMSGEPT